MISVACPKAYQAVILNYATYFRNFLGASRSQSRWTINDSTVANYDGGTFQLQSVADVRAGLPGTIFEFYVNPSPAPVLPIVGINLTGLTTTAQIGLQIAIAIASVSAFRILDDGLDPTSFRVLQALPGELGNTEIFSSGISLLINGFSVEDANVFFYGGQSLSIPILWGPQRAMGPSTPDTIQGAESE